MTYKKVGSRRNGSHRLSARANTIKKRTRTTGGGSEVVEPSGEVDIVADEVDEQKYLVARPATDEATADHQ